MIVFVPLFRAELILIKAWLMALFFVFWISGIYALWRRGWWRFQ